MTFRDDDGPLMPWQAVPAPGDRPRRERPRFRPPVGIPDATPQVSTWRGAVVSIVLHGLLIALLLVPLAAPQLLPEMMQQGAGGPGPAGGGGGGTGGTGGEKLEERVRYIEVAPPPPAPSTPSILPPLTPPPEEKKPEVKPPAPAVDIDTDVKVPDIAASVSAVRGTGGGTGNDGTAGSGPGSGGGVGSGVGTGRGNNVGPGTGGGPGTVYPPQIRTANMGAYVTFPQKLRPYIATAYFDVDERGNSTLIAVQPELKDRTWRKKIEETLRQYSFRPATRFDGTPVRDTAMVGIDLQ